MKRIHLKKVFKGQIYMKPSTKNPIVINRYGQRTKVANKVLERFRLSDSIRYRSIIDNLLEDIAKGRTKPRKISLSYVINKAEGDQVSMLLTNMVLNIAVVAQEIGVTIEQLKDINNWNTITTKYGKKRIGDTFTDPNTGKQWKFIWNYVDGTTYQEI